MTAQSDQQRPPLVWLAAAIWTLPNTVIGLFFGVIALLTGGGCQLTGGCIEFHGGLVRWALSKMLSGRGAAAMTLGHTILGQTPSALRTARAHEHVHVRQYQRWGPLFLPAYLTMSLYLKIRGGNPYFDNPFEIEAYRASSPEFSDEDFE